MMTMFNTMRNSLDRWRGIIRRLGLLLCLPALLLSGCSVLRFTYNQADQALYWWLDGYVDFESAQTPPVRQALDRWLLWHRNTQLPRYVVLLERLRDEVLEPTTAQAVCRWYEVGQQHVEVALGEVLPAVADVVPTLSPAQWRQIEERFFRTLSQARKDYLQTDVAERQRAQFKRAAERFEMLYGPMTEAQRTLLGQGLAASPFDPQRWLDERRARQLDLLAALRPATSEGARSREQVLGALSRQVVQVNRSPREPYRVYQRQLLSANCALAAQMHNSTSLAQRQAAVVRIEGWCDDLKVLAGDAAR
jgi:hypothetical protein